MTIPARAKKWILISAGITVVLVLLALGIIGGYSSLKSYREMRSAKSLLFSAMDSLRKRDVQTASADFARAREKSEKAASELNAHKISVGFLKIVPFAGSQVRALDSFTRIGEHLARAGTLLADSMRGAPGLDAASPEQATMGNMVDTLTRLSNDIGPVEKELLAARKESEGIKTRFLIGRAKSLKKELDEKLGAAISDLDKARKLTAALSSIIGAPGEAPKTYLVLQTDCYELRASGGVISTYGLLQCTHDSIKLAEYERAGKARLVGLTPAEGIPPFPTAGGWMVSYGIAPNLDFWDAGWWPDFKLTADLVSRIWAKNGRPPVDGYVAVDPIAIGYVLEELGPIKVPEFKQTVTAKNLSDVILKLKEQRKANDFLKALSSAFLQKLINANPGQWVSIGRALGRALDERHMIVYFKDPEVEKIFAGFGWTGTVDESGGDYLMAVDSNVGGNEQRGYKPNLFINQKMSVDITRQKDSTLRHRVTYTLDNTRISSTNPLRYKSYLRVFVPEDAVMEGSVAMASTGLVEVAGEHGKRVFGRLVDVPIGASATATFDYVTKGYDSIVIQKQPGIPNLDVSLIYIEDGSIRKAEELKVANTTRVELKK